MKIAIIGPGAIGGVMAAGLVAAGRHEVIFCARARFEEMLVETPAGPIRIRPKVIVEGDPTEKVDWIFVTTKAYAVTGTALWFKALRRENTPVAILQNGVEHRERFAPFLPDEWIVPVMVDCPAERINPTHIRQRGPAKLVAQVNELGRDFAALFNDTEIAVTLTADLRSALWRKLCTNSAGVLSAISMQPAGIMRDEAIGDTARQIVRECIEVGRAEGAVLEDSIIETVISNYRKAPPDSINSLHADKIAGHPMEIDARNGVIVRLGSKHGIATPCNQMAVALIQAMTKI